MITANYLSDIVSGVVEDISVSLEAEEVLFEILSNNELLINEDDIESIKLIDNSLIYRGISYRYIDVDQEDLLINDKLKLIDKKVNDFNSCYYWSKSLSGLNKRKKEEDYKYLVSSKVEGLDMCNLLKCLVRFSRKVKNKGYDNKYEEFYQFRSDFKSQELIVAPNGLEIQLKFLNSSV